MRIRLTAPLMATAALVVLLAAAGGAASTSSGALDAAFTSFPGRVTTAIGSANDTANAVAVQSDGRIVAAGSSYNGSNDDFALVRYKTTGLLNTSFGTGGKVITDFGSGNDVANAVTVKASGKIVVAGRAYNGTDDDFAVARYNADGSLDTTFSGDGKVMTDFGSGNDAATAIAVDSDGKVVVAGYAYNGTDIDFALVRYNADGTPDTSFSGDGLMMTDFGSGNDYGYALVIRPDGKIVVAGSAYNGTNDDFALARYDTGGGLDSSFSDDGMKTTDFGSGNDAATGLVLQPDGKLVAAGYAYNGTNDDFAVARYQPDGGLDMNFSGDGLEVTDFLGSDDDANGLAIQSDGKLVAAGSTDNGANDDFALARYKTDGSLDAGFTIMPGKVTTAIGSADDGATAVAKQRDGKLAAAGWSNNGSDNDFAVVRYQPDGTLDDGFGTGGVVTTGFGFGNDVAQAVAIKSNGKIVVAGRAYNGTNDDFALARYNPDGSLDTSFSGDGKLLTDFGFGNDGAQAIARQPDGKIVVAGYAYNGTNYDFAVARYNSDGTLDTNFSGDGLKMTDFGSGDDFAYGLVRQPNGRLVAAGTAYNGTNFDFALARYKAGGSLDTSFSADGKKTTDFGLGHDGAFGLVLQPDGKLVAAGYAYNGTNYDFAIARYQPDGSLDTNFSGDGLKTTDFGFGDDQANALLLQRDGKLVAAGQASNGTDDDFALARYQPDGSPDSSFSGDGKQTTAFGSAADVAGGLVRQSDDKLVAAGYTDNGVDDDFALARYLP